MFSAKSFSPVSFSLDSFRLSQASHSQDGRSGYWRLFYYQLQEKALAEKDELTVVKPVKKPEKLVKAKHAEPAEPAEPVVPKAIWQECPEPRRKLFRQPQYIPGIHLPDMMWIYSVLNELCFTFTNKRSIVEPSESQATAINVADQDNRVLLLLLAA